jgi:hypothetical protein
MKTGKSGEQSLLLLKLLIEKIIHSTSLLLIGSSSFRGGSDVIVQDSKELHFFIQLEGVFVTINLPHKVKVYY